MMSWSSDGRDEPELGPLEVAWEPSVRSGQDPNVVVCKSELNMWKREGTLILGRISFSYTAMLCPSI